MRRVLLAIGGTLASLLMLLSFKSHTSAGLAIAARWHVEFAAVRPGQRRRLANL